MTRQQEQDDLGSSQFEVQEELRQVVAQLKQHLIDHERPEDAQA